MHAKTRANVMEPRRRPSDPCESPVTVATAVAADGASPRGRCHALPPRGGKLLRGDRGCRPPGAGPSCTAMKLSSDVAFSAAVKQVQATRESRAASARVRRARLHPRRRRPHPGVPRLLREPPVHLDGEPRREPAGLPPRDGLRAAPAREDLGHRHDRRAHAGAPDRARRASPRRRAGSRAARAGRPGHGDGLGHQLSAAHPAEGRRGRDHPNDRSAADRIDELEAENRRLRATIPR